MNSRVASTSADRHRVSHCWIVLGSCSDWLAKTLVHCQIASHRPGAEAVLFVKVNGLSTSEPEGCRFSEPFAPCRLAEAVAAPGVEETSLVPVACLLVVAKSLPFLEGPLDRATSDPSSPKDAVVRL